ncbi:MAG: gamma-glutamyltransferase, partial [Bacteroidota bacterium]
MIKLFRLAALAPLFLPSFTQAQSTIVPFPYEIKKEVTVDSAAVVTAHPLATRVGIETLKKGGNAIDAAVAVHFALAVVYPQAGNI